MSLKINARGSVEELKALYNLLNESTTVGSLKSGQLCRDKDIVNGKQSFELSLEPALYYRPKEYKARDRRGEVYLLATDLEGVYKIGRTKDFQDRKATFNVKLPFPVKTIHVIHCDDMYETEGELKLMFRREGKCLNGSEFFRLTEADVAYIQSL